jgi:methionyl-tRNA formyltransferase
MRIVFMGTPEFAVPSLAALAESGADLAAVVTQPDRPAGRDLRLTPPPVKAWALARGLPVLQPETLKDPDARAAILRFEPDLLVVVAYGRLLPAVLLHTPPHGAINVHASLLPRYRGAAPIQWAILRGETGTGVTIMRLVREMDAGDILLQAPEPIRPDDTAGNLHDRLMALGARCLLEAVHRIRTGSAVWTPQDPARVTYAPPLSRDQARLDWTRPASECHNFIRGLNPWPVACTSFRGQICKVRRAAPDATPPQTTKSPRLPGCLSAAGQRLRVQCGDGRWLELHELQLPGRRAIGGAEFIHGVRLGEGEKFE